jgi:hypothetical protein
MARHRKSAWPRRPRPRIARRVATTRAQFAPRETEMRRRARRPVAQRLCRGGIGGECGAGGVRAGVLADQPRLRYLTSMKATISTSSYTIADTDEPSAPRHAEWKQAKVKRGLEQANDRASLIPADKVWRDLGLEG